MSARLTWPPTWPATAVRRWRSWLAVAIAALGIAVMLSMWTDDIYVDLVGNSGSPTFCGSAYDVVLLKGNGYMGGEMPPNQDAIDEACRAKSLGPVRQGGAAGVGGVVIAALLAFSTGSTSRTNVTFGRPGTIAASGTLKPWSPRIRLE